MVYATFRGYADPNGGFQSSDVDAGVHGSTDRVADELARPSVKDVSEIDEAHGSGDVGQVRDPKLVGVLGNEALRPGPKDRSSVIAVRRHDIPPPLFGLQIILANYAAKLLAIHHHALVTQRRPNALNSVALELVVNRPNPGEQRIVRQESQWHIIEPV